MTNIEETVIPENITKLWEQRLTAKKNKDWETADKIRGQINKLWYKIIDLKKTFKIKKLK
jgi:cysteinyl-tRNA synthetase